MSARNHDEMSRHVRTYLKAFVALMVLTVVTVAASSLRLAIPVAVAVALVIAIFKGSLVVSFFMHLIGERRLIFVFLVITAALLVMLVALPLLTMKDQIGTPWTMSTSTGAKTEH